MTRFVLRLHRPTVIGDKSVVFHSFNSVVCTVFDGGFFGAQLRLMSNQTLCQKRNGIVIGLRPCYL